MGSDGTSYTKYGNSIMGSDGSSYQTYGNTTMGSGGSNVYNSCPTNSSSNSSGGCSCNYVSILVKQRAYILALITTPLLQLPLVHLIPIPMEQDHVSVITAMVLAVAPAFKSHRFVKTNMATLLMEVVRPVTVQRAINGIAQRHLVCLYPLNLLYRV